MPIKKSPFQLLEINVISAQDLAPVTRKMRTYAVAWVHPKRKLSTRVDSQGYTDPTWNDKFVFRVDDQFLHSDNSAVMIQIYALRCFRDVHVGTVRVLVDNLVPPQSRNSGSTHFHVGMRFVALQVRRPSSRPQGILNIGVAVLDSAIRSMPLYAHVTDSAVGYRNLMGEAIHTPHHHHHPPPNINLRRTKSDSSEAIKNNDTKLQRQRSKVNRSEAGVGGGGGGTPKKIIRPTPTNGSMHRGSEVGPASSLVATGVPVDDSLLSSSVGSSVLEGWSLGEGGVEGLRSRLERWRTELPPIYDNGSGSYRTARRHARRHTDGNLRGLFSCFDSRYGCECTIFCRPNPGKKNDMFQFSPSESR